MSKTSLFISGEQRLEAVLETPAPPQSDQYRHHMIAVMCHPHPQYGGTMDDKRLTFTAGRLMREFNCPVLRFNYRGVGRSSGGFGNVVGEQRDLEDVLAYVTGELGYERVILLAYSFGTRVVHSAMPTLAPGLVTKVIYLAPASAMFTYERGVLDQVPHLVAAGNYDQFSSPSVLREAFGEALVIIDGADHFFEGLLSRLWESMQMFLEAT